MNKKNTLFAMCAILVISIAGCNGFTDETKVMEQNSVLESKVDSISDTSVLIDSLEFKIPSSWLIDDKVMYYKDMPVLKIDVDSYDEEVLMKEFQYENTEACVKNFLPNGIYLKNNNAVIRKMNGLTVYEFSCMADKYSESDDMFVKSDDPVYLDYVIQPDEKKIFCLYFMNSMAEEDKIQVFLKKIQEVKPEYKQDGQYRWMITN